MTIETLIGHSMTRGSFVCLYASCVSLLNFKVLCQISTSLEKPTSHMLS